MPLTASMVDVTQAIIDVLDAAPSKAITGLQDVYYGFQNLVPRYPSALVESFPKQRRIITTQQFEVELRVGILIVHGKIQSTEITKKETEQVAELVESELHNDFQLGDTILFGYVTRIDPGVARQETEMVRATRLLWEGTSREVF